MAVGLTLASNVTGRFDTPVRRVGSRIPQSFTIIAFWREP